MRGGKRANGGVLVDGGTDGLTRRAFAASGWQFAAVFVQAALQLVVLGILSRMVTPSEFGTIGVAMIFVGFVNLLAQLGIGPALVQRYDLTNRHIGTGVSLTLVAGAALTAGLWAAAPFWAAVFDIAPIEGTLRLLSFSFLLGSIGIVASALLQRELAFRSLALADVLGYAVGYGGVGIVLATRGLGVWALAWAVIVQNAVRSGYVLVAAGGGLRPSFHLREAREILSYGLGMSVTEVLNYAATRGDYVVVGRWLGAAMLGLYERAYKLIELPAHYVAGALDRVLFPAMSAMQRDIPRLRRVYLNSIGVVALIYLPLAVAMGLLAPQGIEVLFGRDWSGAVAPLQVMCVGLLFRASYKINDSLIRSMAAIYRSAWRVLVYSLLVIGGALVGQAFGIVGVAAAIVAAITAKFLLVSHLSLSLLDLTWGELVRAHRSGALVALVLAVVLWTASMLLGALSLPVWIELLVLLVTAAATVAITLAGAPRSWLGPELFWAVRLLRRQVPFVDRLIPRVFGARAGRWADEPDAGSAGEAPPPAPDRVSG